MTAAIVIILVTVALIAFDCYCIWEATR